MNVPLCVQYTVIGHYTPFFGGDDDTSRARELVMQWYIDNIQSLHTAKPGRRDLLQFFLELDASKMSENLLAVLELTLGMLVQVPTVR